MEELLSSPDLQRFINPLGLSALGVGGVILFKFVAAEILNEIILRGFAFIGYPKLPSREPKPIIKGLERLELKDYTFLVMNQLVEVNFLMHLFNYGLTLPRTLEELTILNTVVIIYAVFLLDDLLYYFLHRLLHVPAIYPYVHKHHHRQPLPYRGYVDAANESPLEQVGGLLCIAITIKVLEPYLQFHALSLFAFMAIYAVLAFLNHTPFDIKLGWYGLDYTVRAHETHHRMLRGNYAQNTMLWDKLFGTYIDYPIRKSE